MMMTTNHEPTDTAVARIKTECIALCHALHTILSETTEGDIARTAVAALCATSTGRDYLAANPIKY